MGFLQGLILFLHFGLALFYDFHFSIELVIWLIFFDCCLCSLEIHALPYDVSSL